MLPIVLHVVGVLQPVGVEELLLAADRMRSGLRIRASAKDLRAALAEARENQLVWNTGGRVFSLTIQGHDALRALRMHKLRDKERILRLLGRAKGV